MKPGPEGKSLYSALVLDDDPEFQKQMSVRLRSFMTISEGFLGVEDFLRKLRDRRPDFCFIDLNLESEGQGMNVLRTIRAVFGYDLPVFVISADSDPQTVAHAIECGANDYFVKPLSPHLLEEKLAPYMRAQAEDRELSRKTAVPAAMGDARLSFALDVISVDELGVFFSSPYLITKGTALEVDGHSLFGPAGIPGPFSVRVLSSAMNSRTLEFEIFAEFDPGDEALVKRVRHWLLERSSKPVPVKAS